MIRPKLLRNPPERANYVGATTVFLLNGDTIRFITYYDIRCGEGLQESRTLFRLDNKAMSPVVAAIILMAVTVALSVAVAAWTGALTFGYMETESLQIQGCSFQSEGTQGVNMTVHNDGTSATTLSRFKIGNAANPTDVSDVHLAKGGTAEIFLPFNWSSGVKYDIFIITATGKQFPYRAQAP